MSLSTYVGSAAFPTGDVPSNISGDWSGYVSCRTDS